MKIPESLCDGNRLIIPDRLTEAYLGSLSQHGLIHLASGPRPSIPPVGGFSQEQTDLHFAHAFDGSVARTQLAFLDPLKQVPGASSTLQKFLSGGGLCLTDVPSGAGASALALLSTVAHLRACSVLPRTPLNVQLLWGEISAPARAYANELIENLIEGLAEQAIFVEYEIFPWDVLCELSNSNLVEKIILAKNIKPQTLLLISNFNGFLEKENKKKEAYPQLAEIFKYCSGSMNAAVWIEPNMNAAKKALFPWIKERLKKITAFAKPSLDGDGHEFCDYRFSTPILPQNDAAVRLCVMPIELTRAG